MSQHEINLSSLQSSYMWTDHDASSQQPNVELIHPYPSSSSSGVQKLSETISLGHVINPRFDRSPGRGSAKVTPSPQNNVDLQHTLSKQSSEVTNSYLQTSYNQQFNNTNEPSKVKSPLISTKKIFNSNAIDEIQSVSNEKRDRRVIFMYLLICILCIALIVVPIALIFGLSKESLTTTDEMTSMTSSTSGSTIIRQFVTITRIGDPIIGLYNTTAGGSTGAQNGRYPSLVETPTYAMDGNTSTKYVNFGSTGGFSIVASQPGVGTGFYVTPKIANASIVCALRFATANDYPMRDPLTVTLEGTNVTTTTAAFHLGSSWTLIYSGPTGIDSTTVPPRMTYGDQQNFSNNLVYSSYRLLITSQRGPENSVQYSEVEILGCI